MPSKHNRYENATLIMMAASYLFRGRLLQSFRTVCLNVPLFTANATCAGRTEQSTVSATGITWQQLWQQYGYRRQTTGKKESTGEPNRTRAVGMFSRWGSMPQIPLSVLTWHCQTWVNYPQKFSFRMSGERGHGKSTICVWVCETNL